MERILEEKIRQICQQRIAKEEAYHRARHKFFERFSKRTGVLAPVPLRKPLNVAPHPHFDPRYCRKKAKYIANAIVKSVRDGSYATQPAQRISVPKKSDGYRDIDVFSIPDSALATLLSDALRERNAKNFSSSSYAYAPGKTPLDAVSKVFGYVHAEKVYISQYDFQDYYPSIDQGFLNRHVIDAPKFHVTPFEKIVMRAIMRHNTFASPMDRRETGIPQGTAMSLFWSNAVADYLDQGLEKGSGNFVRFADDSVVVNYSYEDALSCVHSFMNFSRESGVKINKRKSLGISLLSDTEGEMRTIKSFDFLGYSISKNDLRVADSSISRMKKRISKIIYQHLFQYQRAAGGISPKRISGSHLDWDLVSCLAEIKTYLYGGRKHRELLALLDGRKRMKAIGGPISYYCLVREVEQFAALDGWLLWAVQRAIAERKRMIHKLGVSAVFRGPDKEDLLSGDWVDVRGISAEFPSFVLAWRASRKVWSQHGLVGITPDEDAYEFL